MASMVTKSIEAMKAEGKEKKYELQKCRKGQLAS